MLGVAVPAAALLFPTLLGHNIVVAAVVAEDAATKPAMMSARPPIELAFAVETVFDLLIRQPPTLLSSLFLLKLQSI